MSIGKYIINNLKKKLEKSEKDYNKLWEEKMRLKGKLIHIKKVVKDL